MKTEKDMIDSPAYHPHTGLDLDNYIKSVCGAVKWPPETAQGIRTPEGDEAYAMTVQALVLAAVAGFNYAASMLGPSNHQVGRAALGVLRRLHNIPGPFSVIMTHSCLFPQTSNIMDSVAEFLESDDSKNYLREQAHKLLIDNRLGPVDSGVLAHWTRLAATRPSEIPMAVPQGENHGQPSQKSTLS